MNLRGKIMPLVILLLLVTGIAIGSLTFYNASNVTTDLVMENIDLKLDSKVELINNKLENSKSIVEFIANIDFIIDDIKSSNSSEITKKLLTKTLTNNSDKITLLSIADAGGIMINADEGNSSVIGADLSERTYMLEAISSGETTVSNLLMSKATGAYVVIIATPIYDKEKYIGAVLATIDFRSISEEVEDIKIGQGGYGYMVDVSEWVIGKLISHPNDSMVEDGLNLYDLGIPELSSLIDNMKINDEGSIFYDHKGVTKYAQFKTVGNWAVVITADEDDLNSKSIEMRKFSVLVAVITIIIVSMIGILSVNSLVVNPQKKLLSYIEMYGDIEIDG